MQKPTSLSKARINRIRSQGYDCQSDAHISELAFGNRFAFILSACILTIGVLSGSAYILTTSMILSIVSVILPNHPFDFIYNALFASKMGKSKLPSRSTQFRFGSSIATVWISLTISLFCMKLFVAAYIMGSLIIAASATLCITDFSLSSTIYNAVFKKRVQLILFQCIKA